jgi:hypothetical protein
VGAPGTVRGRPVEVADNTEFPRAFVARTFIAYDNPFVNPDTTIGLLAPVTVVVTPPVVAVTIY